jgi:hypothetical protein
VETLQTKGRKSHKKKKSADTTAGEDGEEVDELEDATPKKKPRRKAKDVKSEPIIKAQDLETPQPKSKRKPRKTPKKEVGAEEAIEEEIGELAGIAPDPEDGASK